MTYSSTSDGSNVVGQKSSPDPLDLVGVDVVRLREDRAFRVGADDQQIGLLLTQVARRARDRAPGSHREDDRVHLAAGLLPDLRPGRLVVRLRVGLVRVLIGLVRAGDLLGQPVGDRVVALRRLRRHRGRADDDFGAVAAQESALLLRDLVRHDEDAAIALDRSGDGEADAGVPARRLHDRPARLELPLPLGLLDHAEPDPVLHAPSRADVLELGEERRPQLPPDPLEPDQRRPPDEIEDGRILAAHGGSVVRRFRDRRRPAGRTRARSCTRLRSARRRASRPPWGAPSPDTGAGGRRAPWP